MRKMHKEDAQGGCMSRCIWEVVNVPGAASRTQRPLRSRSQLGAHTPEGGEHGRSNAVKRR